MLSQIDILNYEVHSSRFAQHFSAEWLQELCARYYAWKVHRKYNRYLCSMAERERVLDFKKQTQ